MASSDQVHMFRSLIRRSLTLAFIEALALVVMTVGVFKLSNSRLVAHTKEEGATEERQ